MFREYESEAAIIWCFSKQVLFSCRPYVSKFIKRETLVYFGILASFLQFCKISQNTIFMEHFGSGAWVIPDIQCMLDTNKSVDIFQILSKKTGFIWTMYLGKKKVCSWKRYPGNAFKKVQLLSDPRWVERHTFFHRFLYTNHPISKTYSR